mgnify:CR=1 FL=1
MIREIRGNFSTMGLTSLPKEVIGLVLEYLSGDDLTSLATVMPAYYLGIINHKLYKNVIITNSNRTAYQDVKGTPFDLAKFETRLADGGFEVILPNRIVFLFVRPATDYTNYIDCIDRFGDLVSTYQEYMSRIPQVYVHINGNLLAMENPVSILSMIITNLINLSKLMAPNLFHLSIQNTEISSMYMDQWGKLFQNFKNLVELNLSGNTIGYHTAATADVLGTFSFPESLQVLILDNNLVKFISQDFIGALPKSIHTLSFNNNNIIQVDLPGLNDTLPNLHRLCLNNNLLIYANANNFTAKDFTLEIKHTNVDELILTKLHNQATKHGFTIVH